MKKEKQDLDLKNIVTAWKNLIDSTPEQDELASKRLKECEGCEHRNKLINVCMLCKCWIPAKVYGKNSCPEKKWDIYEDNN